MLMHSGLRYVHRLPKLLVFPEGGMFDNELDSGRGTEEPSSKTCRVKLGSLQKDLV